ncbi:MAG TPA: hypothetical protein VMR74_00820 [Gammaproteobacteria bacterium]|nr:hypothetical protein [Gammaproteobacteria bacterium]
MSSEGGNEVAVSKLVQDFQSLRKNTMKRIVDRLSDETAKSLGEERGSALRAILTRPLFDIDPSALESQLDTLNSAQLQTLDRCLSEAKEVVRQSSYDYEIEEAVSRVESALPGSLSHRLS